MKRENGREMAEETPIPTKCHPAGERRLLGDPGKPQGYSGFSVLAIDPGPTESAFVVWDGTRLREGCKTQNDQVLALLRREGRTGATAHLAVEMVACYGMPVGREVFETALWIGRFVEAWGRSHTLVYRAAVKLHLCRDSRARDPHIRQALIDRFGKPGTKREPNPVTYGLSGDLWSALAVAVTWLDGVEAGRE